MNIGELHIDKLYIGELQVDKAYLGETLVYGGGEPEPIDVKALKFEARTPGQVLKTASRPTGKNLEYSFNGTTWTNWEDGYEIPFPSDNVIYLRGMNDWLSQYSPSFTFADGEYNVSGNIMHLLDYTQDLTIISENYCFFKLFDSCKQYTFDGLKLPATTLGNYCYSFMFRSCTSLVNAPELPATNLTNECYSGMFQSCTSLENAPELPAKSLKYKCYNDMFYNCTSLVNAPELPATTLDLYCYREMFSNCTSLVNAPELPATTLKGYCYQSMFSRCNKLNNITIKATDISADTCLSNWVSRVSSTGTFKCIQGVEYPTGNSGIPNGWTVEYI